MRVLLAILVTWGWTLSTYGLEIQPQRPDPVMTPGELCSKQDPDYEKLRYKARVPYCRRNVSSTLKHAIYDLYNVPPSKRRNYTIDHFIPLSIGGSNNAENLWPEHKKIKELRLNLELDVFLELKAGNISQEQAVRRITEEKMNPPVKLLDYQY